MARAMKDSGIEWIGKIPEEWECLPARYAFIENRNKNTDGSVTNALKFFNGTIIRKANFDAEEDEYVADTISNYTVVEPDTIMINGLNLNYDLKSLRVGLVREKGVITSAYLALIPDSKKILPLFATYLFKGYETKMAFHNMGAGIRKTLGFKEFKQQPILLPSLSEQQTISDFLDAKCSEIDSVIEKTKASIEEYKKLKQAIITQAVTKGIRGNRAMKDSGVEWIGEIPKEWALIKGHRIITSTQNGLTRRDLEKSDGAIVLKLKNITESGYIDYTYENRIQLTSVEEQTYHLKEGDFLFVRVNGSKNLVGKCAIFTDRNEIVAYNDHIIRVRLNDIISKKYYRWYLMSGVGKKEIDIHTSTAAGQFTISGEGIRDMYVVLPTLMEQNEIVSYLEEKCRLIEDVIEEKEKVVTEIEKLKKTLIYEYVTGKKEVM